MIKGPCPYARRVDRPGPFAAGNERSALPPSITSLFGTRALKRVPDLLKPALSGILAEIDALTARIKEYDRQIAALAGQHKEVIVHSIDPRRGRAQRVDVRADVGQRRALRTQPRRRRVSGHVPQAAAIGRPRSATANLQGGRQVYAQVAQPSAPIIFSGASARTRRCANGDCKIAPRGGKNARKRAVIAVARKIAVLMHRMWRSQGFQAFPRRMI